MKNVLKSKCWYLLNFINYCCIDFFVIEILISSHYVFDLYKHAELGILSAFMHNIIEIDTANTGYRKILQNPAHLYLLISHMVLLRKVGKFSTDEGFKVWGWQKQ